MATYSENVQDLGRESTQERMQRTKAEMQQRLSDIDRQTRQFVSEHPFAAVGAAVLAGYVIARIFSRF